MVKKAITDTFKYLIYVPLRSFFCRHPLFEAAACPFTGYTYTTCTSCGKRIGMEKTLA